MESDKSPQRSRKELYEIIERERDSKLLVFYTGDKPYMETKIASACIPKFVNHLDAIGDVKKLTLLLDTNGGEVIASWNLVNLLRQFCDKLEVVVPLKAMSGGTLICLGADEIMMTKQATLGPIDPSINTPFNPTVDGHRVFVSVEDIRGYINLAKDELGTKDGSLSPIFNALSQQVHPLALGYTYRSIGQIRMLARKLLDNHIDSNDVKTAIVSFLCGGTGSHDYTIDRREAKALGLNIIKPSEEFYLVIKELIKVMKDFMDSEREFNLDDYNNDRDNGHYLLNRLVIESIDGGSDVYTTEGDIVGKKKNGLFKKNKNGSLKNKESNQWRHYDEIK